MNDLPLEILYNIAIDSPESWFALIAVPLFGRYSIRARVIRSAMDEFGYEIKNKYDPRFWKKGFSLVYVEGFRNPIKGYVMRGMISFSKGVIPSLEYLEFYKKSPFVSEFARATANYFTNFAILALNISYAGSLCEIKYETQFEEIYISSHRSKVFVSIYDKERCIVALGVKCNPWNKNYKTTIRSDGKRIAVLYSSIDEADIDD